MYFDFNLNLNELNDFNYKKNVVFFLRPFAFAFSISIIAVVQSIYKQIPNNQYLQCREKENNWLNCHQIFNSRSNCPKLIHISSLLRHRDYVRWFGLKNRPQSIVYVSTYKIDNEIETKMFTKKLGVNVQISRNKSEDNFDLRSMTTVLKLQPCLHIPNFLKNDPKCIGQRSNNRPLILTEEMNAKN